MHIADTEKSPLVCHQVDNCDTKYVSKLSTILVATIQETKDRISQIEYIFCSQLYPNFQSKSISLQKLYSEARDAAENEWKERHSEVERQMRQALDECGALKAEKSKLLARITELEVTLFQKAKEADEGLELHAKLVNLIETKSATLKDKERLMKENDERMKLLVTKTEELERNIDVLNKEVNEKKEEVTSEKKLTKELWKQVESQKMTITDTEQMLSSSEEEKKELLAKIENMEASLDGLRNEIRKKTAEVDEGKQLQEKLSQQVDAYGIELKKKDLQLAVFEREKQMLVSRINQLQKKDEEFPESSRIQNAGATNAREPHSDLTKQLKLIASQLTAEKQKRSILTTSYRKLKSQNTFLLKKLGISDSDLLLQVKAEEKEEESDPLNNEETDITLPESNKRKPASNVVAFEFNKVKQENIVESSDDDKIGRPNKVSGSKSQSGSGSPTAIHRTTSRNVCSLAGGKRPGSGWRETRSRQSPGGADPHDDFLDTPYENITGNLHKARKDSLHGEAPTDCLKDMDLDNDETQDANAESGPKRQQLQASSSGSKGFKYVEPVRKKAERENLNGIECKQCQKFYDAVLLDGANNEVDRHNFRCEHHDGVSRHRYRYVPPMTPEGFWNIGFDTEN